MNTKQLEKSLDDIFVKKAPALPISAKRLIVKYLPWLALVIGVLSLVSSYWLWQWAHTVDRWADYVNSWSAQLGVEMEPVSRMSLFVWVSLAVMLTQAVIYIAAFSPLKARQKKGWNLLFYATLIYVVVGFVSIFISSYGGFGRFVGDIIATVVGLYFLFQIKSEYLSNKAGSPVTKNAIVAPEKIDNK